MNLYTVALGFAAIVLGAAPALAAEIAQAESSAAAKTIHPPAEVKSDLQKSDEGCRTKLTAEIIKAARKKGVVGEFGVQFFENEPFKKAGLTAKKQQMYRYVTPPFVVDEGYISNSKADALVSFTKDSCDIVKLTVNTGGYTQ